ncbi:hypothetical protein HDK64DRAFT_103785 [Phyllosticta capitalensis]|uniref:Uncharacterized protein n=2 Tax=Phyllosticta capitalensis TaxID=121624 RepID=A0ABR1YNZ5_9PEZI
MYTMIRSRMSWIASAFYSKTEKSPAGPDMGGAPDVLLAAAQRIVAVQNVHSDVPHRLSLFISLTPLPYRLCDEAGEEGEYYELSRHSSLGHYPEFQSNEGKWEAIVLLRLSKSTVEIRTADTWRPFAEFLNTLPPVTDAVYGPGTLSWKQALQWDTNGRHFPLMQLPGELRNIIYDHVVSFCYPYEFEHSWNYLGPAGTAGLLSRDFRHPGSHVRAELCGRGRIVNGCGPILSLLLTSKQVKAEFSHRLWLTGEFRFQTAYTLRRFLECRPPPPASLTVAPTALAKLTLQLTTWSAVKFFGAWIYTAAQPWGPADAEVLRGLPLRVLELRLGHREDYSGFRMDSWLAPCCHKVLTGLILWAAKDYVVDIPTVRIEGCVAADVKTAWVQLLADARARRVSSVTEWDVIGHSWALLRKGESWLVRTNSGLGCNLLDHKHSCYDQLGHCTDSFCLSESNFCRAAG